MLLLQRISRHEKSTRLFRSACLLDGIPVFGAGWGPGPSSSCCADPQGGPTGPRRPADVCAVQGHLLAEAVEAPGAAACASGCVPKGGRSAQTLGAIAFCSTCMPATTLRSVTNTPAMFSPSAISTPRITFTFKTNVRKHATRYVAYSRWPLRAHV